MISDALLARLACPVCLEPAGCAGCARPGGGHEACCGEYGARVRCYCGGPDKVTLKREGERLRCTCCGAGYPVLSAAGRVDLVPRKEVGEVTRYADHDFHERLRVSDAPPLLSARVKADMMLGMLAPESGERLLDLGCGAGKLALFASAGGVCVTGVDVAPYFLPRAVEQVELVLADLRRLPFHNGSFPGAYSLDVLEHLDEAGVCEVLTEARRALRVSGRLFVYTHAMESSRLALVQRAVNRLARRLGRAGLVDQEREALRKSDHLNAVRSHEHFEALCAQAGLEVAERRYYNVFFKAFIEDLLLRLYEQHRRRTRATPVLEPEPAEAGAEVSAAVVPRPGRVALALGLGLTWLLKLDVVLFGGIRTGPFFALLRPRDRTVATEMGTPTA